MVCTAILSVWAIMGSAIPLRLIVDFLLSAGMVFVVARSVDAPSGSSDQILLAGVLSGNWLAMTLLLLCFAESDTVL